MGMTKKLANERGKIYSNKYPLTDYIDWFCQKNQSFFLLKRKRKVVALLLLSYRCIVTINVLWLFLTVPWVDLQSVIVVFADHTHLLYND